MKVSDFGLSRMRGGSDTDVWGKMTVAAGTSHWMAPECQASSAYDEKVDVYSYAMIFYEVICREIPFESADPQQVVVLVARGERPDMDAVPPDCPPLM